MQQRCEECAGLLMTVSHESDSAPRLQRLERAFRDRYTGTQHVFISEKTYIDSANVLLGLTDDLPGL